MAQFGLKEFRTKSFGRDVEQFCAAKDAVFECDEDFLVGKTRINGGSRDVTTAQILYLIFHEGYQRCDNDTGARLSQSGHLKCDRLSATCGHQS